MSHILSSTKWYIEVHTSTYLYVLVYILYILQRSGTYQYVEVRTSMYQHVYTFCVSTAMQ
jgi:hypothetical protein